MTKTIDESLYGLMNQGLAFGRNPQLTSVIGGSPVAEVKAEIEDILRNIIGQDEDDRYIDEDADMHDGVRPVIQDFEDAEEKEIRNNLRAEQRQRATKYNLFIEGKK